MSMYMYEGTNAVRSARITAAVLAIILVVAGILLFIYGVSDFEDWAVQTGIALALASIPFFIVKGALRGLQSITRASETYLKGIEEKEAQKAKEEHKTIEVPMQ